MGHPVVVDAAEISSREAEVLAALGAHLSNAQIARRLHISVRTVESHVSALLRKLDASDRQALATIADQAHTGRFAGLPVSRTTFVGRATDRAAILAALDESRLVTVVGPGGVGKTRLVAVVADGAESRFPAGGAFVDLVPARAGSVLRAVADALDAAEGPARSVEAAVFERLRVGRPLLVLDNCEHVIDDISELVERVLAECQHATVLATSRQRLGVTGERLVSLHPLDVAAEAEQLFLDRVRAADPDFAAALPTVAALCSRLDGMPLAIELAAARAASLGADGLLAGLDDQLRLLAGGRGGHARHHSLRAVIGWSYDRLDDDERAMFRRLSAFVGTFDLGAAAAVSPGMTRPEVADVLGRLVDKSLVGRHGAARWRMLDTIRAFGASQVAALGEQDVVGELHRAWAVGAATNLERRLDGAWQPAFDEIAADLRAVAAGSEHDFVRTLAHLTFARGQFLDARGYYRDAAARAPSLEQSVQNLRDAADVALAVADTRAAVELMLEAVARSDAADLRAQAVTVAVRYFLDPVWLPAQRRSTLLAEAAAAADPADERLTVLLATASAWHEGAGSIADLELSRTAVEAARRVGDPVLLLGALDALGGAVAAAGGLREAYGLGSERLRLAAQLPRHEPAAAAEITDAFHAASTAAIAAGDLPAAAAIARRARTDDPIGSHPYIWAPRLVRVLALTGRFDEAVEHAEALWDGWQRDGAPPMAWMSSAIATVAMVHGLRGDPDHQLWRSRALTVARSEDATQSPDLAACLAFVDARVAVQHGQGDAVALVERAFATFAEPWWAAYARAAGAELAVVADLPDAAERMVRAEPFAAENDWAAACLARARGRLGDPIAMANAVERWERIDARFEGACTVALMP
jgi:predicted ATPase/DNA-binding CsgD family transcriptional regulator